MKRGSIIFIIFVLLIAGFLFFRSKNSNSNKSNNTIKAAAPLPKIVNVLLDKKGFSPKTVTIKAGTAVHWKNVSGEKQTVNSDNYPSNQLQKELNLGIFNNGSSFVYTFTKPGIYGYHNQFHHEQEG